MVKNFVIAFLGLSSFALGQIGVGTETPEAMVDIVGDLKIRVIENIEEPLYILVTNNDGLVRKISVDSFKNTLEPKFSCPILTNRDQYNLNFVSKLGYEKPGTRIRFIGVKNDGERIDNYFSASNQVSVINNATSPYSNYYLFTYTNGFGQSVDLTKPFEVYFGENRCQY